jgi:hypothetical protein
MNRLQESMLTYDLQIFCQGTLWKVSCIITSIDPFGLVLQELHETNEQLMKINAFQKNGKWHLKHQIGN